MEGMNPNTTFLLKIKLVGNPKKDRMDVKCFSFELVVDSDVTNFKDIVESVVDKYPPRYLEVAHVQYYDEVLKTFLEIKSDQDLMTMFSKHCKSKVVIMFFIYRGPSDPYEPVTKWDFEVDDLPKHNRGTKKKVVRQEVVININIAAKSPSMCTRSKTGQPASPAMSTRSKRRLSL